MKSLFSFIVCLASTLAAGAFDDPVFVETTNFNERKPSVLVLHYTACHKEHAVEIFQKKDSVSAHYLIDREGGVIQLVDEEKRAWHAGVGRWGNITDLNSASIGIETVNFGYDREELKVVKKIVPREKIKVPGSKHHWFPFPEEQVKTITHACQKIVEKWKIKPFNVIGHSDLAPGRKVDPGPLFPWEHLAKNGVGLWHNPEKTILLPQGESISWMQTHLSLYGYKCPLSGDSDPATEQVVQAFQMHYRPTDISGKTDRESMEVLASLVAQKQEIL